MTSSSPWAATPPDWKRRGAGWSGVWDRRQLWAANGSKSPAARLARETHLRPADTARLVRRARHLDEMPHTAAAHAAGELCGAHVDLVASCQRPWRNADFAASEDLLVELCRTRWFDNAVAAIEHWKLLADRDANRRGADPATDGRHLGVAHRLGRRGRRQRSPRPRRRRDLRHRTATHLRPVAVTRPTPRRHPHNPTAPRRRPRRDGHAGGHRPRRRVAPATVVHRDDRHRTLQLDVPHSRRDRHRPRPVDPPTVRRRHRTDRLRPRQPQHHRLPPAPLHRGALRHVIEIRDQHCQHPSGCDEPATRCDVDHITPHPDGITCLCNGQLLCTFHNRTVKAAHDAATRHSTRRAPPRSQRHPPPCPIDHTPTWTATTHHADTTDTARAPPAAG